ncbi:MAG: hypothetical protein BRD45_03685, partial [Bacteroidetes bacterium QS_8_64_10]
FQTVFGYDAPGDTPTSHVTDLAARFAELNVESLGVETGVDFRRVAEVSKDVEAFLEKQFPGKIHRLLERGADVRVA